jgi:hypothetical protein
MAGQILMTLTQSRFSHAPVTFPQRDSGLVGGVACKPSMSLENIRDKDEGVVASV